MPKPAGYWTKDRVAAEAAKYQTRGAFAKGCMGAYNAAKRLECFDEICSHMERLQRPKGYWTKERITSEALRYQTLQAFQKGSRSAYTTAHREGWLDEVCSHMERLQQPNGYWTKERVAAEALRFESRSAFNKGFGSAYTIAHREGWLDEVCSHMERLHQPNGYWTKERVAAEALRFKSRSAFQKGSSSAYTTAHREGWLDEVCSHMPKYAGHNSDLPCYVYTYYHPEGFAYVGITSDPDRRHGDHAEVGHNGEARWMAGQYRPEYFERHVDYKGTFEPYPMDRALAERFERFTIRRLCKEGWKVVNKDLNPQHSKAAGYEWEYSEACDWCPPHYRANERLWRWAA
jgi:hypothetical protein